nr:hypothetical protein [Tanacetum cinerariifolium]
MSSPNHPTANIEDAFSLNFLDFIPASPDYVPTSPGKTFSNSSNSFGVVPIASSSLLLLYEDPYMKFRMQQYLQHEHYALWEVIEFEDSYTAPESSPSTTTTGTTSGDKSGRTVTLTTEDTQKKNNDVKARTTLLLSLPDEHQLQFKMLEQTFTRLQVIIGQLQFMGVEVKQDDLNQKFLTSLAPEWLLHTIVWRNRSDLETMSLDDLYNHLKVYEAEVQKKLEPNTQNMAFISSTKHNRGNDEVNTASVYTASSNVPTASANVATVSISQETTCAYIAFQSDGSQIKFEDINQINEDDMEEMDIKWNMALLSMRADKFWKNISIQGSDVAGFDKSKVECFECYKMGHFVRECKAPRNQERGRRHTYRQGSKAEEHSPKALMEIDGVGWDWSYMENDEKDHALVAEAPTEFALMADTSTENKVFDNFLCSKDCKKNNDSLNSKITDLTNKLFDAKNMIYHYKLALAQVESRLVEYKVREVKYIEKIRTLEFYDKGKVEYIETLKKELETLKQEKEVVDGKLAGLLSASKDLDNLIESQRKFSTGDRSFPTVNKKFSTASRKFPTGSTKGPTADMGMKGKAVKSSSCWSWKPSQNLSNKGPKNNSGSSQRHIDDQGYWDSACSRTKDETSGIVRKFITKIKNLKDLKVKIIREFCNAKTPQQNGVAERRNRSLIEAARMMLADAKLPVTFWAEAVNTAC